MMITFQEFCQQLQPTWDHQEYPGVHQLTQLNHQSNLSTSQNQTNPRSKIELYADFNTLDLV